MARWDAEIEGDKYMLPGEPCSLSSIILLLAANQEYLREGGREVWPIRINNEISILASLKWLLTDREWTAAELKNTFEGIGEILRTRPLAEDRDRADRIIDEVEVLAVFRRREDSGKVISRGPCWRETFSWRILVAKLLSERERGNMGSQDRHVQWSDYLETSDRINDTWSLALVATAIAYYRAEKGRAPRTLNELVPGYLKEMPRLEKGARDLDLEKDFTWRAAGDDVDLDRWPILRP
jgi:hypothetical protein